MLIGIIKQTLMITSFVMAMMLILEYINVITRGNLNKPFRKSGWLEILSAGILGLIPGCLGSYTAVSMYAHKIFSFPALVTTMIATSGDEAFFMFSVMPKTALLLNGVIFVIAIITGLVLFLVMKNKSLMRLTENHMIVHQAEQECICFNRKVIRDQLKHISFQRAILLTFLLVFVFFLIIGEFGHRHDFMDLLPEMDHEADHAHNWNWIQVTFMLVSSISLFIIATVGDHFIDEHLWNHIIKKHFLKIFLWTFGALIALHYINSYIELDQWMNTNHFTLLIIAVAIGVIPQSGPHFIFVLLFLQGYIPFSVLLANSIVQDGHGAIPLLAESRKSFIMMKLVNILVGFLIGVSGFLLGW